MVPVDPAGDIADFKPGTHQAINAQVTDIGLELGRLGGILVGDVNEARGPLALADQAVIHDAFGTHLETGGGDDWSGFGLPVKHPVWLTWDSKLTIAGN